MEVGSICLILKDTGYKGKIWGFSGDMVTVISISGNAVTVENKKGFRFPCNITELALWTENLETSLKRSRSQLEKKGRKR